jgi:kynurenine formamidase
MRCTRLILVAAPLLGAACGEPQLTHDGAAPTAIPALDTARVVDLTYAYDADTVYWPTDTAGFRLERLAYGPTEAGFFYAANAFSTAEHGGTHLDAPIHFAAGGWTTEAIPLERLLGPAVVIDVAAQAAVDRDYTLTVGDVEAWEGEHGAIPEGAIVLLRTGWGRHWPDRQAYLGDDTPGDASNLDFPSYGNEAAQLLVGERRVAVLGVDTASIDPGTSTDFQVHRVASQANVAGLENVANLDELPATGAWIIALPMKIAGGSGAPTRIIALLPG